MLSNLDNPIRLLFWTLDEIIAIFILFVVVISCNSLIIGILSIFIYRYYAKFTKRYPKSVYKRLFYWYLPLSKRLKVMPPSYIRIYLG